jgi:hypothetical protein
MMDTMENLEKADSSCVKGLSRKEFLKKVLGKAVIAGTLAAVVNTQIAVHPSVAQIASATAV